MDKTSKRILIAPLDWGLGHVSRCVPLIRFIRSEGHEVIFAGNQAQCSYMQSVFGHIECMPLKGYDVRYARFAGLFMLRLLSQVPRLWQRIRSEHKWLQLQLKEHRIDAVISDNRYGLYTGQVPCVLITHQLLVLSGAGRRIDLWLQKVHYRFIARFSECWVPDTREDGLSGLLGHPEVLPPVPLQYLGLLSQCYVSQERNSAGSYLLVLLSGTEPQRSILSRSLWQQLQSYQGEIVFVEGTDQAVPPAALPGHISWYGRVAGETLRSLIAGASLVICRSGYSSLMDLRALNRKAILIPTPGQTEQEYLAAEMQRMGIFMASCQQQADIRPLLSTAEAQPVVPPPAPGAFEQYQTVLLDWLQRI